MKREFRWSSTVKIVIMKDILGVEKELETGLGKLKYVSLKELEEKGHVKVSKLPFSIRILLENIVRNYDGFAVNDEHLKTIFNWKENAGKKEIPYKPARILMQDFTGVPAVVDLASMRSEMARRGKDPRKVNPVIPVDLVIDHSVQIDFFGTTYAFLKNVQLEYERNKERYQLLKWAQNAFENFRVVPPGMGICHQVNLEYLAKVVFVQDGYAFPDTLVGTDSHTPMVNGIGVVGWGVGGIEAEAALLGQPIYMILPEVIGLKLTGELPEGATSTDLVLTITELLRKYGVVGKFVEVFGPGLENLTVPDRATISNMSPEFGCTVTYFPVDDRTLDYLRLTGRDEEHVKLVEKYMKENLLWRTGNEEIEYTDVIELDLSTVEPSISGPRRPQDRIPLRQAKEKVVSIIRDEFGKKDAPTADEVILETDQWEDEGGGLAVRKDVAVVVHEGEEFFLANGSVVIASITSCTNTSNPMVMLGAGLVAKKAVELGLESRPWVKTSLAPGSRVVTRYLERAGLLPFLESLRFHVVGYGCTTCIGNSGPLPEPIAKAIVENDLVVASVLSGNRNFEARIHPLVKMNFLASPMLVVAYAIAGRVDIDMFNEPLAYDPNGQPVYLKDIWPSMKEIRELMEQVLDPEDFKKNYAHIFDGDEQWQKLPAPTGEIFDWDPYSTYIKEAPFFKDLPEEPPAPKDIRGARVLLLLGDTVTTDHISPAGVIPKDSPAGKWLMEHGVEPLYFNTYGSRRGNHEVMIRGTFANVRLRNLLVDREGGWTIYWPTGEIMTVYEAAMKYKEDGTPLIVIAGKEYGTGSSRDWAAKGTALLGIKAVIAESFERIHRSNLVGMGVLPLQFLPGQSWKSLGLKGDEVYDIIGIEEGLYPHKKLKVIAKRPDGSTKEFEVITRLDSDIEVEYWKHGGILQYVLRKFLKES